MAHGQEDDREQQGSRDEEDAAVEDGETQADGVAGKAHQAHSDPVAAARDGLDQGRLTELGA